MKNRREEKRREECELSTGFITNILAQSSCTVVTTKMAESLICLRSKLAELQRLQSIGSFTIRRDQYLAVTNGGKTTSKFLTSDAKWTHQ